MTLLSNLQGILDLAKWADWLIAKWSEYLTLTVSALIALFHIKVATDAVSLIAMALFVSFIAVGAWIENHLRDSPKEHRPVHWENVFNRRVLLATFLYALEVFLITSTAYVPSVANIYISFPYAFIALCYVLYCSAIIVGLKGWPWWTSAIVAVCMVCFSFIFGYSSHSLIEPNVSEAASASIAGVCAVICGFLVVAVAPPLAFTKRLIFMIVGVALIVLLSQLGRLGITATPEGGTVDTNSIMISEIRKLSYSVITY